jgi:hypothetical protein
LEWIAGNRHFRKIPEFIRNLCKKVDDQFKAEALKRRIVFTIRNRIGLKRIGQLAVIEEMPE